MKLIQKKGLVLWVNQGGENKSSILGSFHLLDKLSYPLSQEIESAYLEASEIFFECELDIPQKQQYGIYPEGESLLNHLSYNTISSIENYCRTLKLNFWEIIKCEPWLAGFKIFGKKLNTLGISPEQGIDKYFLGKARVDKKIVHGLETIDQQLSFLQNMSPKLKGQCLIGILETLESIENNFKKGINFWKTGNIDGLEQLMLDPLKKEPELYNKLIVERNRDWFPKIYNQLKTNKNSFFIVGALHLIGDDSLIEMLNQSDIPK